MMLSANATAYALIALVLWTGLLAGFFFAWTNPAMMGFAETSPAAYVEAMQQINRAVQNPVFFVLFFGSIPVALIAVALTRADPVVTVAALLCLAWFLVTVLGNVPMNEAMDGWRLTDLPPAPEIEAFRARWQMLNTTRAVLLTAALALSAYALSPLHQISGLLPERGTAHAR